VVKIVTLTGTLPNTSKRQSEQLALRREQAEHTTEDGETTMSLCNVVDEFLNQHSLANTSSSEQTDLSTTSVGRKKVDNLDTGFQDLGSGRLVNERRRVRVDGGKFNTLDRATFVNGFANNVHDSSESCSTDRDHDGSASVNNLCTSDETFCTVHGNGTYRVLTQVGRNLQDETTTTKILHLQGIKNGRKVVGVKFYIHNGTNDGFYGANCTFRFSCIGARSCLRKDVERCKNKKYEVTDQEAMIQKDESEPTAVEDV
jgi:hypothetical protein